MERYRTIKQEVSAEQMIERSRFIAHACPVSSREEAEAFIARIRAEYRDATHNVPAMVIGEKQQIQWGSDDGEPQGTSGAPMVQLMVAEGLTNLVVVVTRYFGGVKLGTGGLVRAYTGSARKAIEAAGICRVCDICRFRVRVDYPFFERIRKKADDVLTDREGSFAVVDTEYGEKVTMTLLIREEYGGHLEQMLTNLTAGRGEILETEIVQRPMD